MSTSTPNFTAFVDAGTLWAVDKETLDEPVPVAIKVYQQLPHDVRRTSTYHASFETAERYRQRKLAARKGRN